MKERGERRNAEVRSQKGTRWLEEVLPKFVHPISFVIDVGELPSWH